MQGKLFKGISLILVLVLLVNMLPVSVFAQQLRIEGPLPAAGPESPGIEPASPATETASVVAELKEERTAYSKKFLLDNGLHMAAVYTEAVHYETDGGWQEIDNTLKARPDGTLTNTAGVWNVVLPGELDKDSPITVEKDGHTLSFRLSGELKLSSGKQTAERALGTATEFFSLSQTQKSPAQVKQVDLSAMTEAVRHPETVPQKNLSRVAYTDICENTDIIYDLESNTIKESVVLKSYSMDLRGYRYTLEVGDLVPELQTDGRIVFYGKDGKEAVLVMPAPFLIDAENVRSNDVQVELTGSGSTYTLTYLLPTQWLAAEDRAWPVILDPVVQANIAASNIEDQTICEKSSFSHTWGMVEAGYYSTQGKTRFLVKYKNLPTLTSADVVMGAWFSLYKPQNSSTTSEIDVHKVTGSWSSQTVTWANKPGINNSIEDYELVQAAGSYAWEVTDIVREWYATNNYGMLFKAANSVEAAAVNNYKQFYSSDYGDATSKPILEIIFRNNNGISGYWDYSSVSAGTAGSGHINNFTGNLVWVRDDIGFDGNRMPVTVSHVYNANDKENNDFGMGWGWRTNFNQLLSQWSENSSYYVWEDEDGTDRYFKLENGIYKDEDGQELTLTINTSGNIKYVITDKQGGTRHFDTQGRLVKIQNNQQTPSSIAVTYTTDTGKQIATVTDGASRIYDFTYNSDHLLDKIRFMGKGSLVPVTVTFDYTSGHLVSVTDPAGKSCRYVYNNKLLNNVVDIDGYAVSISYNTITAACQPYRVKAVSESHKGQAGGSLTFTYAHNQTAVKDHNNNAIIMQFNNMGNTVSIQDNEGRASFGQYEKNDPTETNGRSNQMRAVSRMQNTVDNGFRDGSFEFGDFWTRTTSADLENVYTTEVVYHGDKALKMSRTAAGDWRGLQSPEITAQPGETVTISVYVKTEAGKVSLDIMDSNMSQYINGSGLEANRDWTRLQASYTNNSGSAKTVFARLLTSQPGVTYVDCAQAEKTVTASRFNLVSNGDFHGGLFAWTKLGTAEDQTTATATAVPQLDNRVGMLPGSATSQRSLYQTVKVRGNAGDSFVLSGWAMANAAPLKADWDTRGRKFAITAKFNYTDGSPSQVFSADFNPDSDVWQYSAAAMVAEKAYSSVTVSLVYHYNVNTAYFDGIQLYKEAYGSSYTYDGKGNVLSVTDLQNQRTEYEYNTNNDLVKVIENGEAELTYTYDSHHNVTGATTKAGLVYSFTYDGWGNMKTVAVGNGQTKISASAVYSADGNRPESITDATGGVTKYSYNEDTNILEWVALPEDVADAEADNATEIATRTRYEYDELFRVKNALSATDTGRNMSVSYAYEDSLLTGVETPTTEYGFLYRNFGLRTQVTAGDRTLATYTYTNDRNHYLEKLDYGNGDSVQYTYDTKGRLTGQTYEDGATVTYAYDNDGNLAQTKDSASGTRKYYYDLIRRTGEIRESRTGLSNLVRYTYDAEGLLSELYQVINGTTRTTAYTYDDDNRVTSQASGTAGKTYSYDAWGRLSGNASTSSGTAVVENSYTYQGNGTNTSGQVASMTVDAAGYDVTYSYTYDKNGNILSVSDGTYTTTYAYDSANQLIRENNQAGGFTHVWYYDAGGNILGKEMYAYTTGELGDLQDDITYAYGTNGWGDVLVYSSWYGGTESDDIGNITYNRGNSYTWRHGRELAAANGWTFTYDADGLRTKRTDGTTTYDYSYIGGQLWYCKVGSQELFISWDENSHPWTLQTGGETYWYVTNLQGDVTAILNAAGNAVVTYTYDAWGNLLSVGGSEAADLGQLNPLRYRGYVYDRETGLYYLQSRYYDPEMGRFINADSYVATGQGFIGNNMFAYCGNNPVIRADPSGHSWLAVLLLAGAAALILCGCGNQTAPPTSAPPTTVPPTTIPPTTAPSNDYDDFLDALAISESSGNQGAVNEHGFQGLYQMGSPALQDAGFKNSAGDWTGLANSHGVYTNDDYLNNPAAQKVAVTNYHKKVCGYIRYYGMEKYIGTSYQGVTVTYSGLLAACHLVGSYGMADALKTGAIITDGNGTPASYYLSLFAGYNISEVWD